MAPRATAALITLAGATAALITLAGGALRAGGLQQSPPAHEPAAWRAAERPRGEATVMALAAYARSSDVSGFPLAFVNSLRGAGFAEKIIVGMWENTTDQTDFLRRAAVTPRYIRQAPCQLRYSEAPASGYVTRNVCTEDFPHLKLDNARWVYGLRWLEECPTCSDWVMYADFGDIPRGQNPFDLLPRADSVAPETVYLTEEMRPRTDGHGRLRGVSTSTWLVQPAVTKCFGQLPGLEITSAGSPCSTSPPPSAPAPACFAGSGGWPRSSRTSRTG
ncbi:unnamed protein product [Prorocentrum cordatum]|uniref:Uncharacterized protein n=1 Tax=Prorocentrum cordatum TaxID=2364126 RepID=A0ABN9TZV8_9DINO|nr:unnamed protein product [Polarella glacialis]